MHVDRSTGVAPRRSALLAVLVSAAVLLACGDKADTSRSAPDEPPAPPAAAPPAPEPTGPPSVATRVADLLARMTLDEKLGQMTMVDRGFLASESDITTYALGAVVSGGGSAPETNTAVGWADMVDGYQRAALATRLAIPIVYGADGVHGHGNLHGATLFPHNIGLGAARDPQLVEQVARATAEELAGAGVRWNFAPTVSVARDERSGRTFESFGELPESAASAAAYVAGTQGATLGVGPASALATAKHWIADGATDGGEQFGDAQIGDAELRAIHLPPFVAAMRAGVGSVMIAHSSVNGVPMHANRHLVTDVLKGELAFGGVVVSDWGGTWDVSSDFPYAVRSVVNAGIDMVMVPDDYRRFISTLRDEVNAGRVPMSRIDDAVGRILAMKFQLGVFERPFTDRRFTAGVGSAAHRALARRAVSESLVLLKNDGALLPLAKTTPRIFVAGKSADDVGNQAGGWTMSWQGASGDIVPGTTILGAIRATVGAGTTVTYARDATGIDRSHDVAVVVIGETPYAEWYGDTDSLELDEEDRGVLAEVKRSGVPTIVVIVSGRPLIVTDQLPDCRALVAAWLPGTEGQGVADVLFGDAPPSGRLPFSWPRSMAQVPIRSGDSPYDPLFPYGFGLTYPGPGIQSAGPAVAVSPSAGPGRRRE
jgi:beta-glucosidase